MTAASIFSLCNSIALISWLMLMIGHRSTTFVRWLQYLGPALFGVIYFGIVVKTWGQMSIDSFNSLESVKALFNVDELLLAGWLHYLAFDLFVGCWIVQNARQLQIPFLIIVPALFLTFMFGPIGYITFLIIRSLYSVREDQSA